MQQFFSLLSWRLFTAQHVSGVFSAHHQELNDCSGSLWFYLRIVVIVVLCSWSGRQHDYHYDTKLKLEAATAIIELLMMGEKTPETCWAVNKRQDNKLKNCCIRLVIYLNVKIRCQKLNRRGHSYGSGTALQAGKWRVRFPMVSLEFFHLHNPSGCPMALGSTQTLTEMSTRNISGA